MRFIVVLLLLFAPSAANALTSARNADSFYAGVFGGISVLPDLTLSQGGVSADLETDVGFNLGAVAGYKWAFGLRAEGEVSYRQNDLNNIVGISVVGDISALAFMGNGWYDFDTGTPLIPYLGGGLGFAVITIDSGGSESDTVFAWQIGAGIGYEVTTGVVVSADYRFLATSDPSFPASGGDLDAEYMSHGFLLGVRGHF